MDYSEPSAHSAWPPNARGRFHAAARVALAAALVGLGAWTLWSYLPAFAWAGVFAIALWPVYTRVEGTGMAGRHNVLIPAIFTLAVALVFLVPLALVGIRAGQELRGAAAWAQQIQAAGMPVPDWLGDIPLIGGRAVEWWQTNLAEAHGSEALLRRFDGEAVALGRSLGAALLHRALLFGFTLLILFFLFRDGLAVTEQMLTASRRAFGPSGERVGRQVVASVRGTVNGLALVGLGEGAVLGVAYAIAAVPHPVLFGVLTAIAAMIPFGAPLAFGIAALLLLAHGSTVAALVIVAFGFIVVFVADHVVRPILIGGATRLPFLWVLLGILGGLETWGLLGLFLGPAVMAALILLWREWTEAGQA